MSNTLNREQTTIDFEAGTTKVIELPRSHYYERLSLLMDWDVTVNTADTPQNGLGILDLVQDISVQFNGSKVPKSTGLGLSHYIDWYQYGTRPEFDAVDLSTASQQTGRVGTYVDFLVSQGEYGTMLPSFVFSDLTLSVTWGTDADIADDVTVNDASISVASRERKRKSVPSKGRTERQILQALSGFKETERSKSLTVTGEETIDLPQGNEYYAIPMLVLDGDSPSNDLVDSVAVEQNGVTVHKDKPFSQYRAADKQQYGIEERPTGFAYLNYGLHGNLEDIQPTAGLDAFEMTVDTEATSPTDPAEVRYVTQELVR